MCQLYFRVPNQLYDRSSSNIEMTVFVSQRLIVKVHGPVVGRWTQTAGTRVRFRIGVPMSEETFTPHIIPCAGCWSQIASRVH